MGLARRDGGTATELELQVPDEDCFAADVSERLNCRLDLESVQRRSDGHSLVVFAVEDADPARVSEACEAADDVEDCQPIGAGGTDGLVRLVFSGSSITTTLADAGAVARRVTAADGAARVVAVAPRGTTAREVTDAVDDAHADVEVLACRRGFVELTGRSRSGPTILERLTDRQAEAVRTAYDEGYFEWPRAITAADCAATLDVSQPTFSEHLRAGERKLLEAVFGDETDDQS